MVELTLENIKPIPEHVLNVKGKITSTRIAQVFTLTKTNAERNPSEIASELSIFKILARVLIDSGATHSFALPAFIKKIKKVPDVINSPFSVKVPSAKILNSKQLVKPCEVSISGHKLCVDLIILKMHDYDVTLGMHWLSKHHA